jgi:Domain of unknown function (DUF4260)
VHSLARMPAVLLRLEGGALFAGALALYFHEGFSWLALVVLFLAPDVAAAGYLAGPRIGALAYDVAHTEALPIALAVGGVVAGGELPVQLALIWLAHIGVDRLLGYGLKYPSGFRSTHLQRV